MVNIRKRKGSAILAVVVVCGIVCSLMTMSMAKATQSAGNSTLSNSKTLQAQSYAVGKIDLLRSTAYSDLKAEGKTAILGTDFFQEVTLSSESNYTDSIKQKTATVKVYKGQETIPRASLRLMRYSAESTSSSVPQGSIIPWYGSPGNIPNGFALCDGKNGTPDLRDRFLVGAGNAYKLGDIGGENSVKLAPTQIGNHYHAFGSYDNNNGWFVRLPSYATFPMPPGSGRAWWNGRNDWRGFQGPFATQSLDMVTSLAISTAAQEAHENRPPYYALHYIMKL